MVSQSTDPDEPRRGCLRAVFWNDAQHRLRTVWRILIGLIVWGLLAAGATGMALLAGQPWLQWPGLLAVTLLMMVLTARLIDRRPMRSYGLRLDGHWYADLGLGLLLGAALMAGIYQRKSVV